MRSASRYAISFVAACAIGVLAFLGMARIIESLAPELAGVSERLLSSLMPASSQSEPARSGSAQGVSAHPSLPYLSFPPGQELSADCQVKLTAASALLPLTTQCASDADCEHFPCSCDSISASWEGKQYQKLWRSLGEECGGTISLADCGETVPVCNQGHCGVSPSQPAESVDDSS